jgi:predicted dehydrogenase
VNQRTTRRDFLKATSLAAAGILLGTRGNLARGFPVNEKLNIGVVGVSGRGGANLNDVSSQNIVALCDVDDKLLAEAARRFPRAGTHNDFRQLVDRKDIDAVVVSTPDHTHAVVAVAAMKAGKHVYCEKPLAHTVHEVRVMRETAKKLKRVTQMGTQIHAGSNYRRVVELIQTGAIGAVRECHVWCGKNWGGGERPKETPPVPETLHYDLWLGPAPYRPYHPVYLPQNWRRWWDFGGGTLADMGCHYMDLAYWALKLRYPNSVEAKGPAVHPETAAEWLMVEWEFPARESLPACRLRWYDGGKRPDLFAEEGKLPKWGDGVLFAGEKGMLIADYDRYQLLPEKEFKDFKAPAPFIPASIGHHNEWIAACKDGPATSCNFEYSGTLAEAVLLGTAAYRSGQKLAWDGEALKVTNHPEAMKYIRREYREPWTL